MILMIVRVQFLAFDGNLPDRSVLLDMLRVPIPYVHGEVPEFPWNLELELLAEKRRQSSLDDWRSADFLLIECNGAIHVPEGARRQGVAIEV